MNLHDKKSLRRNFRGASLALLMTMASFVILLGNQVRFMLFGTSASLLDHDLLTLEHRRLENKLKSYDDVMAGSAVANSTFNNNNKN